MSATMEMPNAIGTPGHSDADTLRLVRLALRAADHFARRFVRVSGRDLQKLEALALQWIVADDEGREQIVETAIEVLFPEQAIGPLLAAGKSSDLNARRKEQKSRQYIGEQIRKHRKQSGMTQAELAKRAELLQSHVSRLEKGMHFPTQGTIEHIAHALKIEPAELDPGLSCE